MGGHHIGSEALSAQLRQSSGQPLNIKHLDVQMHSVLPTLFLRDALKQHLRAGQSIRQE